MNSGTTHLTRHIKASRSAVYQALISADAIAQWKSPADMTMRIHHFDGRPGGTYRISLTYNAADRAGKTTSHTDTYHGRFIELKPDERVVEEDEFETTDPTLQGRMTATITLTDEAGGTLLDARHEGLPPGVSLADNQLGWQMALDKLAALVERP